MIELLSKVGSGVAAIGMFVSGLFGAPAVEEPQIIYVPQPVAQEEELGADTVLPIAGATYYMAGTGISSSATSFTLTSFTIPQNGKKILDSELSDTFYLTLEPGNRTRQEIISCTTVVQNANDTATISGCTRGLSPVTPYTASSSLQFAHAGGSIVIFSNPPQLFEQVGFLGNDENITGSWTTSVTPTAAAGLATKGYVDGIVSGGAVTLDGISVAGTAGDTFATGTIVYFDTTSTRWEKASASVAASSTGVQLGVAQGAGTDGTAISGGVLLMGYDTNNVGGTAGNTIYLSDTAGATSTSAGTISVILGEINSATSFYFNPLRNMVFVGGNNTFTGTNTFSATTTFNGYVAGTIASSTIWATTTTGVYTKPANLRYASIECQGSGGNGSSATANDNAGGGGGGYSRSLITASAISATTSVTVGAAGAGTGNTSFGTLVTCGNGGNASTGTGGSGGAASSGNSLNVAGGGGQSITNNYSGGAGGSSYLGKGGAGGGVGVGTTAGGSAGQAGHGYGAGGGGSGCATDGDPCAGAGAGTVGIVIVTEYY